MKSRRRYRWALGAGALLALLVALPFGADLLARWETRRLVADIERADVDFDDASVGFLPPTYRLRGLTVLLRNRRTGEPFIRAEAISVRPALAPLLHGRLVIDVTVEKPVVVLEQPIGKPSRLPEPSDLPVGLLLRRLRIENGAARYAWVREKNVPAISFSGIQATLRNVPSRPGLADGPMTLEARGSAGKKGEMAVHAHAASFRTPLSFAGGASVESFDVAEMNRLVEDQKGLDLKPGSFSMAMTFEAKEGKVSGEVSPRLEGSGIAAAGGSLLEVAKAELSKVSMHFQGAADGTNPSGAIAFEDDVDQPGRQLLPTLEKVIENGFLLGLQEGLKRAQGGGGGTGDDKPTKLGTP